MTGINWTQVSQDIGISLTTPDTLKLVEFLNLKMQEAYSAGYNKGVADYQARIQSSMTDLVIEGDEEDE